MAQTIMWNFNGSNRAGLNHALDIRENQRPHRGLTKTQLLRKLEEIHKTDARPEHWAYYAEMLVRRGNFDTYVTPITKYEQKLQEYKELEAAAAEKSIKDTYSKMRQETEDAIQKFYETAAAKATPDQTISEKEMQKFFRSLYIDEYKKALEEWTAGSLFAAQEHGFNAFLCVRAEEQKRDTARYREVEAAADMCGERESREFLEIRMLYWVRIRPWIFTRRQFFDLSNELMNPSQMKSEQQQEYWRWWRKYNLATFKNKWKDDSGVAYDPRTFDPEEL